MKRKFEITWPDTCGQLWMNADNLLLALSSYCKVSPLTVRDATDDHRLPDAVMVRRESSKTFVFLEVSGEWVKMLAIDDTAPEDHIIDRAGILRQLSAHSVPEPLF